MKLTRSFVSPFLLSALKAGAVVPLDLLALKAGFVTWKGWGGDYGAVVKVLKVVKRKRVDAALADPRQHFKAAELKALGFSAKELKAVGYSATELKAAGIFLNAKELKAAGFSVEGGQSWLSRSRHHRCL